uniref:Ig-like domain-containing protein n=1 Tax=Biomphalaria glabrata TaxID=6526 RepID=A0A2C9KTP4_BIOGL
MDGQPDRVYFVIPASNLPADTSPSLRTEEESEPDVLICSVSEDNNVGQVQALVSDAQTSSADFYLMKDKNEVLFCRLSTKCVLISPRFDNVTVDDDTVNGTRVIVVTIQSLSGHVSAKGLWSLHYAHQSKLTDQKTCYLDFKEKLIFRINGRKVQAMDVKEGSDLKLLCRHDHLTVGLLTITKDGHKLIDSRNESLHLVKFHVTCSDSGIYQCLESNVKSDVSHIRVLCAPTIIDRPTETIFHNESIHVNVRANPEPVLTAVIYGTQLSLNCSVTFPNSENQTKYLCQENTLEMTVAKLRGYHWGVKLSNFQASGTKHLDLVVSNGVQPDSLLRFRVDQNSK